MPRWSDVETYCASLPDGCPDEPIDCEVGTMLSVERGCGFAKYMYAEEGDGWTAVYDSRTGALVHYTRMWACGARLIVGAMPYCEKSSSLKQCARAGGAD